MKRLALLALIGCSHDDTALSWDLQNNPIATLDYGDAVCFVAHHGLSCLPRCPPGPPQAAFVWDKQHPVIRQDGPTHSCFVGEEGISCVFKCP